MKKPVLKLMNNTHWKNEEIWENWRYWSIIIEEIYLKSARSTNYMNWKWKDFFIKGKLRKGTLYIDDDKITFKDILLAILTLILYMTAEDENKEI